MKKATILAFVAVVLAGAALLTVALEGCALHNPVNVEPDYPPPVPFAAPRDAGHE